MSSTKKIQLKCKLDRPLHVDIIFYTRNDAGEVIPYIGKTFELLPTDEPYVWWVRLQHHLGVLYRVLKERCYLEQKTD